MNFKIVCIIAHYFYVVSLLIIFRFHAKPFFLYRKKYLAVNKNEGIYVFYN